MRDAEAQVSMNELRQRIADLNREWQLHDTTCKTIREKSNSNNCNLNNDTYDIITHELLAIKMREAQTDCDNRQLSQQLMDVETQKQVLHNQIKRQDEEIQKIRLDFEQSRLRENELQLQLSDIKNHIRDGEFKVNKSILFFSGF
jgi:predicted  nucleic acid-binding Zn-ribbon protein